MLQTHSMDKRVSVCQMWPRPGSERMKRTGSYVTSCSEHGRPAKGEIIMRAQQFLPM
jgi:hypothetical protein